MNQLLEFQLISQAVQWEVVDQVVWKVTKGEEEGDVEEGEGTAKRIMIQTMSSHLGWRGWRTLMTRQKQNNQLHPNNCNYPHTNGN